MITFVDYKHAPHVNPGTKELNENFFLIQNKMSDFFYNIIEPEKPEIMEDGRRYYVMPKPSQTSWQVEGDLIVSRDEESVEVVWIRNAPQHRITVSATMPNGTGYNKIISR